MQVLDSQHQLSIQLTLDINWDYDLQIGWNINPRVYALPTVRAPPAWLSSVMLYAKPVWWQLKLLLPTLSSHQPQIPQRRDWVESGASLTPFDWYRTRTTSNYRVAQVVEAKGKKRRWNTISVP